MAASRRVAISGVATTEFARVIPDKTSRFLQLEAAVGAIHDAGLSKDDIDGIVMSEGGANPRYHIEFSEYLGIYPKTVCTGIPMGGATPGFCVDIARWAIESDRCHNVLIVAGGKESGAGRSTVGHGFVDQLAVWPGHSVSYEHPFGPLLLTFFAVAAQRHMYEFGTTSEQLAAVAVACRKHASLNPEAVYRDPITVDDVLSSRMISTPFHLLDCSIMSDGAVAFVVSSAEAARDAPNKPAWVIGTGGGHSSYFVGSLAIGIPGDDSGRFGMVRSPAVLAAEQAFGEAGVSREDIDLACVTDNFSFSPIAFLEDMGFCKKGDGGPFVEGGRIELGGELPVNPHGGLLSCNHAATNFQNYVEAVCQLRGDCGARQVADARLALVGTSAGVTSTHQVAILAAD